MSGDERDEPAHEVLEALEALGLPDELPAERRAEELFLRFQALVPYETASREGGPRTAVEVLAHVLEDGSGSAGAERARAFETLARAADVRLEALGAAWRDEAGPMGSGPAFRTLEGAPLLLDPGLPLPFPLRLNPPAGESTCGWGRLSQHATTGALELSCEARGRTWTLASYDTVACDDTPPRGEAGEGAAKAATRAAPHARRILEDRMVTLEGGRLVITDAWSRLDLPAPPAALCRDLLGAELTEAAAERLSRSATTPPAPATLTVFHRAEAEASALLDRLATPAGYLSILPPDLRAAGIEEEAGNAFTWTLTAADAFLRRERIGRLPDGIHVERLEGDFPLARRRYTLEKDGAGTLLSLRAELAREIPPRGLAETVRRTLVFHMASELLAIAEPGFLTGVIA